MGEFKHVPCFLCSNVNNTEWRRIVRNTVRNNINNRIIQEEECPVIKLAWAKFIEGVTKTAQKD